jgi:predicted dinucleotide-binding enzyme
MTARRPVIGIIGAGRLGGALGRLAARAGYEVHIAASTDPKRIPLAVSSPAPQPTMTSVRDAAARADVVILALPLARFRAIPAEALAGKLVIDAMNYWWEADGLLSEFTDPLGSSSEVVQRHLAESRVVKAFNHMGYRDLEDEARPAGETGRKAIGIAGDRDDDLANVSRIVDEVGFDPVVVGTLADGVTLEPGTEPFGADVDADELREMIAAFPRSQRGIRRAAALRARDAAESAE